MHITLKSIRFILLLFIPLFLSSCLTCERKEYIFHITGENSGRLTIRYVNIFSSLIDSTGEINADWDELNTMWMKGNKIESDFPLATNFKKRLFEENGKLCGEITMEFNDLASVRIYQYKNQGPYMFSLSGVNDDGETFSQTNGEFGGDTMPVIFWPREQKTLRFSTKIAEPDSSCVSMLKFYNSNKKKFL
jgi:hypothetical protein